MYERRRNIVVRRDGRRVNVARFRGQLFICATGCCCGRTEDGFAPVPTETFHREWERRRLRNVIHLTIGGCLGPCALANVALLLFDGQAQWFHSIDSDALAVALYDHVEAHAGRRRVPAAAARARAVPVHRLRLAAAPRRPAGGRRAALARARRPTPASPRPPGVTAEGQALTVDRVVAVMEGQAALPRKNGELVFEEPWQGRVFGMAVALHERGLFEWEEFRQTLIAQIAAAEARPGPFVYYEIWLQTFEDSAGPQAASSPPPSSTRRPTSSNSANATTCSESRPGESPRPKRPS